MFMFEATWDVDVSALSSGLVIQQPRQIVAMKVDDGQL